MTRGDRHFGMDWLRIGAFGLLILFHIGMTFSPWAFSVKLSEPHRWIVVLMFATSPWRLSLLFVVSGYASAALFARRPAIGAFLRSRIERLGLPLLFGMAVIVPWQPWVELASQHDYAQGFGHFFLHDYFGFRSIDGIDVPSWMHLWFVAYLIVYTLLLAGLLALPAPMRQRLRSTAERVLAGPLLLPLGIAYGDLARGQLPPFWIDSHQLSHDWSTHAVYLAAFLFGVLLRRSEAIRATIRRQWPIAAGLALAGYGLLATCEIIWPGDVPVPLRPWYDLARSTQMWATVIALIGLADRYANHDNPWRAMLAEAVFPFYIIHQTLIVLIGYALLGTATGTFARFLLELAGTVAGCWLFYLAGRLVPALRPWIGLRRDRIAPLPWRAPPLLAMSAPF